jgi:hypothetical protein
VLLDSTHAEVETLTEEGIKSEKKLYKLHPDKSGIDLYDSIKFA